MSLSQTKAPDLRFLSSYKHVESHPLRFKDQDIIQRVNITIVGGMFESSRMEFWRAQGLFPLWKESGFFPVKATVEYLRQLLYPDTIRIGTRIEGVGDSSVRVCQALFNAKEECCALAETVSAHELHADGTFSPLPAELRKLLESAA